MSGLRLAWSFLTRLPGGRHPDDTTGLGAAVPWFPVVGAFVGVIVGSVYAGAVELVDPTVAALLAVAAGAIVTGALHEDGLADVSDSLGGHTRVRRLEIMRDSRIGTFAALALVLVTMLKVAGVDELSGRDGFVALVAAHALGRAAATGALIAVPQARTDGLGSSYAAGVRLRAALAVLTVVAAAAMAAGRPGGGALLAVAVVTIAVVIFARRAYGGVTGDVLGAIEQLVEAAVLVVTPPLVTAYGWGW